MTVYFIRQKATDFIKIGKTIRNPKRRLQAFQTANPVELELIAVAKQQSEDFYHHEFQDRHMRGEWYSISERDLIVRDDLIFMPPLHMARILWEMAESLRGKNPSHSIVDEYPWGVEMDGTPKPAPNPIPRLGVYKWT